MKNLPCRAAFFMLSAILFLPSLAYAQATNATVTGQITDQSGRVVTGVQITFTNLNTNVTSATQSNSQGNYRLAALTPGIYRANVSKDGFASIVKGDVELHVQDEASINFTLRVGSVAEVVTVQAGAPLINTESSAVGAVVDNQQIEKMPLNGRNYLDLMQLVPGVAINRQANQGSDVATPVLGERGGNSGFLIDGMENNNEVGGGAAAQFNEDSIAEFRVNTTGYKAEFGHSSGGVINVITRSGTNQWHGTASLFHRNNVFDSSNTSGLVPAPDPVFTEVPYLLRWDYGLTVGGPILKDKVFMTASVERIRESRELNFVFPANTPPEIQRFESGFDNPNANRETRIFGKLDERLGRHSLTQEINLTNSSVKDFLPLSQATDLPSTRTNSNARHLLLGFSDTILLGQQDSPFILNLRGQYRGEPSALGPAHPDAGPYTYLIMFSNYTTGLLVGDLGIVNFGSSLTRSTLDQKYGAFGANLAKDVGRHSFKFGWDFLRTHVDGVEANLQINQVFATLNDFTQFGPIDSGLFSLYTVGGATPDANQLHLRNNYSGLYLQDDWKVTSKLTLNLGARWDYDSQFKTTTNISPRIGFAWAMTPKTVVRGSWGLFYDHFRLGLARDIPGFGGADLRTLQPISIPRLFYGNPSTFIDILGGLCVDKVHTDAEVASQGLTCPYGASNPYYGVDHLNSVVAAGHAPIPDNSVVNLGNVQNLTGYSPQEFVDAASAAVGQSPGYFYFGPFGALTWNAFGNGGAYPVVIDPGFKTPYTSSYSLTVEHQFGDSLMVGADYFRKDIYNISGVRQTNLSFDNRIPGNEFSGSPIENGYGPWYAGTYDGAVLRVNKRFGRRFSISGSYNYVHEVDDALCSNFDTGLNGTCYPTDSFIGTATLVTDPGNGKTNADGPFVASNGNFVPKAGTFWNGPRLDRGPSDFALTHTLQVSGLVSLPWKLELSNIFRMQSGFRYSRQLLSPIDQDGNFVNNLVDFYAGRNHFQTPAFANLDTRISRSFKVGERVKIHALFEVFNLFNNANPAAVQARDLPPSPLVTPFGKPLQVLPGREGQVGLKIEF
jgi:hypothetical protein